MFQFGGAGVYVYVSTRTRAWSSCLAPPMGNWRSLHDWNPQQAHAYCLHRHLFRWIARKLQTPSCFQVGQRHGLRHLLRHSVKQEQSQDGAHDQIKLPRCNNNTVYTPDRGTDLLRHNFQTHGAHMTQTCLSSQDTIDKYISWMEVKMDQIMAVDFCNPWGDLACHVKAHWFGCDAVPTVAQPSPHMQDVVILGSISIWYIHVPRSMDTYPWIHPWDSPLVLRLPNSLAAAKLEFGSCQTRAWQLPHQSLATTKPEFGSCQTEVGNCQPLLYTILNELHLIS